jgi:hypothetical protein
VGRGVRRSPRDPGVEAGRAAARVGACGTANRILNGEAIPPAAVNLQRCHLHCNCPSKIQLIAAPRNPNSRLRFFIDPAPARIPEYGSPVLRLSKALQYPVGPVGL